MRDNKEKTVAVHSILIYLNLRIASGLIGGVQRFRTKVAATCNIYWVRSGKKSSLNSPIRLSPYFSGNLILIWRRITSQYISGSSHCRLQLMSFFLIKTSKTVSPPPPPPLIKRLVRGSETTQSILSADLAWLDDRITVSHYEGIRSNNASICEGIFTQSAQNWCIYNLIKAVFTAGGCRNSCSSTSFKIMLSGDLLIWWIPRMELCRARHAYSMRQKPDWCILRIAGVALVLINLPHQTLLRPRPAKTNKSTTFNKKTKVKSPD